MASSTVAIGGSEFWLISVSGEKTPNQTFETCQNALKELSEVYKFNIPELKVGTLDTLVGLSDDMGKLDIYVEGVVRRLAQYTVDVLEGAQDKIIENLRIGRVTIDNYLEKFQWDSAKYPVKQPLRTIVEVVSKQVSQIENDLKVKSAAYNNLRNTLQTLERKSSGSLVTRSLVDLVKKEDFVVGSEYLVTLLVIVPKTNYTDWLKSYETFSEYVVPKSSSKIFEDAEQGLFTVTLFRKHVESFKSKARERRFLVRDFEFREEEIQAGKNELSKLMSDKQKQFGPLVKWLKVNFSDAFIAWNHVKALRTFVESVLRFGLPVNFQAMLVKPGKKNSKKLRDILDNLYGHLDSQNKIDVKELSGGGVDISALVLGQADYYPYVCFPIRGNILEH